MQLMSSKGDLEELVVADKHYACPDGRQVSAVTIQIAGPTGSSATRTWLLLRFLSMCAAIHMMPKGPLRARIWVE
eukprot:179169-Pelagomonas_calceolata.AAC.1